MRTWTRRVTAWPTWSGFRTRIAKAGGSSVAVGAGVRVGVAVAVAVEVAVGTEVGVALGVGVKVAVGGAAGWLVKVKSWTVMPFRWVTSHSRGPETVDPATTWKTKV